MEQQQGNKPAIISSICAGLFLLMLGHSYNSQHTTSSLRRTLSSTSSSNLLQFNDPKSTTPRNDQQQYGTFTVPQKVNSGWDEAGWDIYKSGIAKLERKAIQTKTWPTTYKNGGGEFAVMEEWGVNRDAWDQATNGQWEVETYRIFDRYINVGETVVVDFGTWIGPTLLYHGMFSFRSFGIEADPMAFATVEANVALNRENNPTWGERIFVDSGCIVRPQDVGQLTMKGGLKPGTSVSGIGEHVVGENESMVQWQVACYTLPDIMENYWGIRKPYVDVFLKIDVESYECKLIPSFYDWLVRDRGYLPKMFISFHPQIQSCTDEEYAGVIRFMRLYDHVSLNDVEEIPIQTATVEDFKSQKHSFTIVLYQDRHAVQIA